MVNVQTNLVVKAGERRVAKHLSVETPSPQDMHEEPPIKTLP